jgi:hypothetical protein
MTDQHAIDTWNKTIKGYFSQLDVGAMRGQQWIKPALNLSNMESVVLHCYDSPTAKSTFSNNPDIYPAGIRGASDFNWGPGIISRVKAGTMPPGENSHWSTEWCTNLENWVTKYWPPVAPVV